MEKLITDVYSLDQINEALEGMDYQVSTTLDDAKGKLLCAVALDECGCNEGYYHMLRRLRGDPALLDGCTAGLIVTGQSELYTKSIARTLALSANMAGCAFIGRPLVEATGSLRNFSRQLSCVALTGSIYVTCTSRTRSIRVSQTALTGTFRSFTRAARDCIP